jgi:transposase
MLLPCDLKEWVESTDLVHFVLEALSEVQLPDPASGRGTGSEQYPPGMLLALLVYSYATGVFSSRKIERLTHQSVSVRYLCGNTHPDHDTIASFRTRHQELFKRSFAEMLKLARELKLVQLGTVYIDGTKILADASKRATYNPTELEQQLELADRELTQALLEHAEEADRTDLDEAFRLPRELANAAQRKARLQAAREALAARAATATPGSQPRTNLTDPDSRLMPQANGTYVQGYNAQLAVEAQGLIVGQHVCQSTSDITALKDTACAIEAEPGQIDYIVVDQGYDSQQQIDATEQTLEVTVVCEPTPNSRPPSPRCTRARAIRVAQRLKRARFAHSPFGQTLLHERQTTIEPVIGSLKHNLGFRRFHLRGLQKVNTEWTLLTTAYNCRTLWQRLLKRG